ncbi:hypothetical protein STEG23_001966 [Scotinomys teguina]
MPWPEILDYIESKKGAEDPVHCSLLPGCRCKGPQAWTYQHKTHDQICNDQLVDTCKETQKTRPVDSQKTRPVDSQKTRPVDSQKTRPVNSQKTRPVNSQKTRPVDSQSWMTKAVGH